MAPGDSITVAVCAERMISSLKEFCSRYHHLGVKHVGCSVKGVCGFVCDDFLSDFKVLDSDGEVSREVTFSGLYENLLVLLSYWRL